MKMNSVAKVSLLAVLSFAMVLISGCATAPPVDWNSRVGHYTYAQAINELGPRIGKPISAMAEGSQMVHPGRWHDRYAQYYMNNGFDVGPNNNPGGLSDRYLQLTFDTNGVLSAWSKNY